MQLVPRLLGSAHLEAKLAAGLRMRRKEAADSQRRGGCADVILAVFTLHDAFLGDEIPAVTCRANIEIAARQRLDVTWADGPTVLLVVAAFIAGDRIMVAGIPVMSDDKRDQNKPRLLETCAWGRILAIP